MTREIAKFVCLVLFISCIAASATCLADNNQPLAFEQNYIAGNGNGPGDGTGNDGDGPKDGTGYGPGPNAGNGNGTGECQA